MLATPFRLALRLVLVTSVLTLLPAPCAAQYDGPGSTCCFSSTGRIGPSGGEVAAAAAGIGVVAGVGIYLLARPPRVTGCVVSRGSGLGLQGSAAGDPLYLLEGDTGGLHAGERVKVIGRRHRNAGGQRVIRVGGVAKVYGTCSGVGP